jgi:hypothetical protein
MFLFEEEAGQPSQPGFPGTVHHSHRPLEYTRYTWTDGGALTPADGTSDSVIQTGIPAGVTFVALQSALAVPFAASSLGQQQVVDNRYLARMTLFPTGELPRQVQAAQLGGGAGNGKGTVPSAVVDEALFFDSNFGTVAGLPGQLVLAQEFADGERTFTCRKDVMRSTLGDNEVKTSLASQLPQNGGLLRIGDEILCYDSFDPGTYVFTLPRGGRGLLGTEVQAHRAGEGLTPLSSSLPAAVLGASIGPDDADLALLDVPVGFPAQGTVWMDGELAHYTRIEESVLSMPRASSEPGEMDAKGPGLFRGRFGTQRASHDSGTPVILFPCRYWDRWCDLADAPEMTYFRLSCDQPDAFWKRVFWKVTPPAQPGPEFLVLQRTDPDTPWDTAPADGDAKGALRLLTQGKLDAEGNPIGVQSDRIEWRAFVRHAPGSFDPDQGLAHGWKTTPRLELFGVEYMGRAARCGGWTDEARAGPTARAARLHARGAPARGRAALAPDPGAHALARHRDQHLGTQRRDARALRAQLDGARPPGRRPARRRGRTDGRLPRGLGPVRRRPRRHRRRAVPAPAPRAPRGRVRAAARGARHRARAARGLRPRLVEVTWVLLPAAMRRTSGNSRR